jgi:hypothetical protein
MNPESVVIKAESQVRLASLANFKFRHVQLGEELRCSILANNQRVMLDL